jgi:hypothetical protein
MTAEIILVMRVAMTTVVALLILSFVDEHYNEVRYARGTPERQRTCFLKS